MGKRKELELRRRVDWMADTIDELREQWTNKQLECELLKAEREMLREEVALLRLKARGGSHRGGIDGPPRIASRPRSSSEDSVAVEAQGISLPDSLG